MPRRSSNAYDPTPWVRCIVKVPERDLGEALLDAAQPLLDELGPQPNRKAVERAISTTVKMWNAIVLSREHYPHPRVGPLNRIRESFASKRRGETQPEKLATLLRHIHSTSILDPRLVDTWTLKQDDDGRPRLACTMKLPVGVEFEVAPPIERRISVGGVFLDQLRIRWLGPAQSEEDLSFRSYPIDSHRALRKDDGNVMIQTHPLVAMQIFAEGRLPPLGSISHDVTVGGQQLGAMKVVLLRCVDEVGRGAIAQIVLQPA